MKNHFKTVFSEMLLTLHINTSVNLNSNYSQIKYNISAHLNWREIDKKLSMLFALVISSRYESILFLLKKENKEGN
jgi:hypothetical protein